MELLAKKQKNVVAAEKRLKQLEKQLTRASDDKKSLQDEVQELSNKIKAATDMVLRLEAERVRWEGELEALEIDSLTIPGDALFIGCLYCLLWAI